MDSDLAITMQEWESGVMIERAMKIPNHCSAREKKQKQLLGITGNRTQGWKHYANILTPSIREEEGKGEIKMSTFMKGNWTQTPASSSGNHRAMNYWKRESSGRQLPCSYTFLLSVSAGDRILARRTSALTWPFLLLISHLYSELEP